MGLFHKKTEEEIAAKRAEKEADKGRMKRIYREQQERFRGPEPAPRPEVEPLKFSLPTSAAHMLVKRVFRMGRKDVVVTGTVARGSLRVGDEVFVWDGFSTTDKARIVSIGQFSRTFDEAPEGAMVQVTLDAANVFVRKGDILFRREINS